MYKHVLYVCMCMHVNAYCVHLYVCMHLYEYMCECVFVYMHMCA